MFLLAWLSSLIGLASIIGAFAAGLIVSERQFEQVGEAAIAQEPARRLDELFAPLEALFAPIFFVLIGMQVNLATFLEPGVLWLALGLTVAAILGKVVAGVVAGRDVDRTSVGIGMIPRGEVGLIFASVGKGLGVLDHATFSAIVIMVLVTTLVAPLALKWSLSRT